MRNNIIDELTKSNNIVLLCHKNPDGDAIGSVIALYHALKKIGKEVDMVIKDAPTKFSFIYGYDKIKVSSSKVYDTAIIVDTADINRVNNPDNILDKVNKIIVIDHHISNTNYGNINYIKKMPACAQIIYNLIKKLKIEIDNTIGVPIAIGLITDTGGFSHSDVKPSTFKVAGELSKIVPIPDIYRKVYGTISNSQFELKKITMNNLEFYQDGKIAFSYVTYKDIRNAKATNDECDILIDIPREIEGVEVSILARVYEESIRVSLRSNNVDVNEIAAKFGGGGHKYASGITTEADFKTLKEALINEVGKKIDEWNTNSR